MNHITAKDLMLEVIVRCDKTDVGLKADSGGKYIITPWKLCQEIVTELKRTCGDSFDNKTFLVVDTIEFVFVLLTFKIDPCNITYIAPYEAKSEIARRLKVKVIEESLLDWKTNMKFDVVIGNPPYVEAGKSANEIYTTIIQKIVNTAKPDVLSMIVPENFLNGGQKKKQLRENLLKDYKFSYINFLNQARDWNNTVAVDTAAWILLKNYSGKVSVKGRHLGETYLSPQLDQYINGENQYIYDWIMSIQTPNKIRLVSGKKTVHPGKELKISSNEIDSLSIVDGTKYNSHNDEWRVAFGYMRCSTCSVVPPGISIPLKYKYKNFGNDELLARKFASFMLSAPIRLIMKLTYTSRTLDNPQLSFIPLIDLSKFPIINEIELYNYWKCSELSNMISDMVGNQIPF